ncbi:transposase, partial [uncultured Gimesia sp.]|uniref:transposase n=1 Tax=uncultured Gimesia sp. TaxID=1678688 RepID=UPI0026164F29
YHVLNRANARMTIFETKEEYAAFEQVLSEAIERFEMRLLSYCVMPNHWHLVVHPRKAGELSKFVGWLTLTHTQRWHSSRQSIGTGHVYQGRFKSFPVQDDAHINAVCQYVERNPLSGKFVRKAENWQWSSLHRWKFGTAEQKQLLSQWPIRRKQGWLAYVNKAITDSELQAVKQSIQRGCPYGDADWTKKIVKKLNLESTITPRGRPRKCD